MVQSCYCAFNNECLVSYVSVERADNLSVIPIGYF